MRCYRIKRAFLFKNMKNELVKSSSYMQVHGWMINELGLRGNELWLFGLIHGFSKDNMGRMDGGRAYMAEWIGCSKSTIDRVLNSLLEKELIIKSSFTRNKVTLNSYHINYSTINNMKTAYSNRQHPIQNEEGVYSKCRPICIDNNIDNNIDNSFKQKTKNSISSNSSSSNNTLKNQTEKKKKNVAPKKSRRFGKAEFRKILIEKYNCDEQHVHDWFQVRDKHKAAYTKTSLRAIVNECIKNDYPVKKAIEACASNSWRGFKYAWIENLNNSNQPKFNQPNNDFIINR